ncbi:monovalent cation:proton antiporter family protein [Lederbergia citrea]|uniref:Monovalent cation:proton antiporter family protein n=1 Tax=Lederbergia citrea TaxID=2833581 RepID=A0A942UQW7_9BACI|nr:monovalent cation:proton antiporter family protein [Lederbergia citrea]MBS4177388.1 monovalent cation:proton antiporter family protein [Lederbergia citrea]MBS4204066.1 monovalent cation:proton antiporter family protein [Lederbergia citrea]MBS4221349.1 monovalent cation:proton antiporter family protein [Lederbergia citrea]
MEHESSLISLVIVLIVAFITPLVLHRFRLTFMPVVIAEIIMGLIIGKSGLNLIHEGSWLTTLSTLGFIFLMFLSGLEIDFSAFKSNKKKLVLANGKHEPNRLAVSTVIFAGIFLLSIGLSYIFVKIGLIDNVLIMTLIISTISLGVVVPTLKEANIMKAGIGQIILLVAVIADLVTMILLAVFVSVSGDGKSNMWLLLILFAAGILLYFIGRRFKNRSFVEGLSSGTVQIGTRAIFTLIIVLVALSETVGAENILGAFLAGTLVSLLNPNQDMVRQLDSFGYGFVIPIFFVMVGVHLDLWSLLSNKQMLLLIPLLLIALFVSKVLPVLILRRWYDMKTVMASAFLLTSTLSLVIAAAKIAERINVITPEMSGTFILVAVISCIVTPILFKKWFPKENVHERKLNATFIGANQLTLPVSKELNPAKYKTTVFHKKMEKGESQIGDSVFNIVELNDYKESELEKAGVFEADILFISTGDEELNARLAIAAKEQEVDRVVARIETPVLGEPLKEKEIEVFSTILSTTELMKALIETPNIAEIMMNRETSLYEIHMLNREFDRMTLREFPFMGDVIVVRVFRGKDSIVPHGDTELHMDDRLIVTGSKEYVDYLIHELQYSI